MPSVPQPSVIDTRPFPGLPAQMNLAAHALACGAALPDKPALEVLSPDQTEVWTYARLSAAIRGCGSALLNRGLVPGDRILLRLGNGAAFPVAYLGAIAAGLVPVATSAALTVPEVTTTAALVAPPPDPCRPRHRLA
jgi:acyl-CoA synthetase (AMP-forming)/AMP-acid ligase II